MERIKQVILIRKDLKMRRGKEIAQGSHAAMLFMLGRLRMDPGRDGQFLLHLSEVERFWIEQGMAKVCLQVDSEQELLARHGQARALGLVSHLVRDSGRTEFGGVATYTACAIGPEKASRIDAVTADLALY